MSHDVFISYSTKDATAAGVVLAALEAAGVRCWIAPRDVTAGVEYGEAIVGAIAASGAMVLVFSPHANESPQVRREVERAGSRGIPIVPLRVAEAEPTKSMEFFLSAPHWLDAFDPPIERHMPQLVDAVRRALDPGLTAPARMPRRATARSGVGVGASRRGWRIALTAAVVVLAVALAVVLARKWPRPLDEANGAVAGAATAPADGARALRPAVAALLSDVEALDARLAAAEAYVRGIAEAEAIADRAREMHEQLAPARAGQLGAGYDRYTAKARVVQFRAQFQSKPLQTPRDPAAAAAALAACGADARVARQFADALVDAEAYGTAFLDAVTDAPADGLSDAGGGSGDERQYHRVRHATTFESFRAHALLAHLRALNVLYMHVASAPQRSAAIAERLAGLQRLEPRVPIPPEGVAALEAEYVAWLADNTAGKGELLRLARRLNEQALADLQAVNKLLEVRPTDKWFEVVGKARTLRQLGRTTEAAGAFSRYADLAGEPTAGSYSKTAVQFTLQLDGLGVTGGMYLFELNPGSPAEKAGMAVGDIVVRYNGQATPGNKQFIPALKDAPKGEPVQVEYLRLDPAAGKFIRHTATLPGGSVGGGLMPI